MRIFGIGKKQKDIRQSSIFNRLQAKAVEKKIPIHAFLELTNRCNLRCRHCYINHEDAEDELSLPEWIDVLDQLTDANILYLTFSGGEILTRPDFFQIAEYARKKEFCISLFTNGTLITPEVADRIKNLYPERVEMTLYGWDNESCDWFTQAKGSFRKTLEGVRLLRKRKVPVQLKITWTNVNIDHWREMERIIKKYDCTTRSGFEITHDREWNEEPIRYRTTEVQLKKFFQERLDKVYKKLKKLPPEPKLPTGDEKKKIHPCGVGQRSLTIDSHGNIYPCCAIPIKLRDIKNDSFMDIFKNSPELNRIRAITLADLTECKDCKLWARCNRCAGAALMDTDSLLGKSLHACLVAKAREEYFEEKQCELE